MKTSQRGRDFIKGFEKLRLKAYNDNPKHPEKGRWTCGWGRAHGITEGTTCTAEQAEKWFQEDLAEAERYVRHYAGENMTQGQWDALVSCTFNGGPGMLKKVLDDGLPAAGERLPMFCCSGGEKSSGLLRRRLGEQKMFEEAA